MSAVGDGFKINPEAQTAIEERSHLRWPDFVDKVFELDLELIGKGIRPPQRSFKISSLINEAAGNQIVFAPGWRDPVLNAVSALLRTVYGEKALGMGPIHVGVIMIRDAFIPVYVPGAYGEVRLSPWDFVDQEPANLKALTALSSSDTNRANDQLIDIWDFGWAVNDRQHSDTDANILLHQARDQIESACMTLQGSFSQRIALQGTAYAVELALKSALTTKDLAEEELSKIGHNLKKAVKTFAIHYPNANATLLRKSVNTIPPVVGERYGKHTDVLSRRQIGEIVAHGQFVLGEIARAISDRDLRSASQGVQTRHFPS